MVHLKHIGPHGIRALGDIFTASMATSTIPTIWQKSIILPLLKFGRTNPETSSYCPISLLCPAIKITRNLVTASPDSNTSTWLAAPAFYGHCPE